MPGGSWPKVDTTRADVVLKLCWRNLGKEDTQPEEDRDRPGPGV